MEVLCKGSCCVPRFATDYQGSVLELETLETWGFGSSGFGAFGAVLKEFISAACLA